MKSAFPRFPVIAALVCTLALTAAATNYDVEAGGSLPASSSLATSDTITLKGNPAALTATYALGSASVVFQSDDNSTYRAITTSNGNANLISFSGGTLTFDRIILQGAKTTGNNAAADGATLKLTGATTINGPLIIRSATMTSRANGGGAGIHASGELIINDGIVIENSYAAGSGAGIYAAANFTIAGSSTFANNAANGSNGGGAILFYVPTGGGVGTLDASKGDITFTGNTASGAANAISVRTNNSGTLVFNTGAGAAAHTIYFYDPIAGTTTADAYLVQNGDGTVVFDTHQSSISAVSTINSGTLKLTNNAILGRANNLGAFTLRGPATLVGNGTIMANDITLETGATLEVLDGGTLKLDAAGARTYNTGLKLAGHGNLDAGAALDAARVTIGTSASNRAVGQTLTLAAGTALNIADGGTIDIGVFGAGNSDLLAANTLTLSGSAYVNIIGSTAGSYKIITADNDLSALTFVTQVNGIDPTGRYGAALSFQNSGLEAWVALSSTNIATIWTGLDTGGVWKNSASTDANWSSSDAADTHFITGDRVSFTNAAALKAITIDSAGVTVADMTVNNTAGNDYTFTGSGGITGSPTDSTGLAAATGKLIKTGAGALNFENTGANTFAGGIELAGGTLGFTAAAQLGAGGNGIAFTDNATLRANADALALANNISIAPGKTAAIDTAANTLTLAGTLSGDSTAALVKTGAGVLTLSGNNAAFAAATNIQQGSLLLAGNAQLGGAITLSSGATFGGAGSATGSLVSNGGIIQIGTDSAAAATLNINTLTLNSSILRFDIFSTGTSDRLLVTNPVGISGANTIDINSGVSGTFNLGNLATLSGATVTVDSQAQAANSRVTATLTTSGADLLLIAGADMSRIMRWTGATDTVWANANWTDGGAKDLFANGDRVIFAAAGNSSITIADTVTVSDMIVEGAGNHTFTGAGITADAATVITGTLTGATGKLVKTGAGTLAFGNSFNNFKGGIELGGGVIDFTSGDQLAAGGAGITFVGDAALKASAGTTLLTNIRINDGVTGTIDTGLRALVYSGTLSAGGNTATLAKIGEGSITLTADSSGYTGQVAINEGSLILNAGNLGGNITVGAGATFGGHGTAAAVNALENSTVNIAGALTIAELTLNGGSALTGSGTLAGAASLLGDVNADISTGSTLLITATTSGAGALTKLGDGSLTYSGAASLGHTGETIINQGYVLLRDIAAPSSAAHAFVINGGWLDLSESPYNADGSTANDWASLLISQGTATTGGVIGSNDKLTFTGGSVDYNIGDPSDSAKKGVFVVIDAPGAIVTLTGSNSHAGYTRIDSGTLSVSANSQLGDTALNREVVLNGGVLQITGSLATNRNLELRTSSTIDAQAVALVHGDIVKSGTEFMTLTLTRSITGGSSGFNILGNNEADAMNIEAGAVFAHTIASAGRGDITVASGATFGYSNISSGTALNKITGQGVLSIRAGSTITLAGDNDIANIAITGTSSVTGGSATGLGTASTIITVSEASRITLAAAQTTLGYVTLSGGGQLAFASGGAYKHATLSTLAGTGTGNILAFNTNIAAGAGDKITVNGPVTGGYILNINNTGGAPADATVTLDLLTAPVNKGDYTLSGGKVDAGMLAYTLEESSGNSGYTLRLVNAPGQASNTAQLIKGMAGAMPANWFAELDSVNKRMGELRMDKTSGVNDVSTWVRGYARRLNIDSGPTGAAFHDTQYGADAGIDYKARGTDNNLYLGAFVGYGQAKRDFSASGDGRSDSAYGGVYATIVLPEGWYGDAVIKGNSFKNRIDARNPVGAPVTARYNTNGVGISLEGGKYIALPGGWFVEPQLMGEFATLSGKNYSTSNHIDVTLDRANSTQTRGGFLFGRAFVNERGEGLQAYAKLHGAYQWTVGGDIHVAGEKYATKIEGSRVEAGGGIAWTPVKSTQIYMDYECAWASDYTKPFSINFGIRHTW